MLHAFWRDVAAQLMLGRLVARGFKAGADQPNTIRPEFFSEAVPDYKASSVTSHGLTYYGVRIFAADPGNEVPVSLASAKPSAGDVDERLGDRLIDGEEEDLAGTSSEASPVERSDGVAVAREWLMRRTDGGGFIAIKDARALCPKATRCHVADVNEAWRNLPEDRKRKRGRPRKQAQAKAFKT